ncbi:potassium channel family protein [Halomicroarcula sp. GCM10025894]|uniref:potassium channel family protein n=1 Tax=Halomicroarcula sp. GCM10025894 TaxID=3252673 RepID=UPI00361E4151
MNDRSRRTAYYLLAVAVTTVVFTLVYNYGMATLENRPQPLYRSLEVVFQTFTTTGYGEDAGWDTLWMNLLVILMQLTGIGLILAAVDVFVVPWLRRSLAPSAPERRAGLSGHVVVCGHTARTDAFISELDARGREYVLVVADEDDATDLQTAGYQVLLGDPEATATLRNASIDDAVAVVADGADDTNASIALSARDVCPDVRVVTLVEDASLARYHRAAGADEVLSPRQLLGESLSRQVPTTVTADIREGVPIDEDLQLAELTIAPDSGFAGRPSARRSCASGSA